MTQPLAKDQEDRLREIILAWYTVGYYGGFGEGGPHFISDIGAEEEDGHWWMEWWVDMGSLEPTALMALESCIVRYIELHGIQALKLTVGLGPYSKSLL